MDSPVHGNSFFYVMPAAHFCNVKILRNPKIQKMKTTIQTVLALGLFLFLGQAAFSNCEHRSDDKKQYKHSDNFSSYEVQVKGDIKVTKDDSGVKSISPGGYLKVSKKTFGNKRSVIIVSREKVSQIEAWFEGKK